MKRIKKFKLLRRQNAVVYINAKVKAYDLLSKIKKKIDKHRVLICIQTLMKKGKSEKALKIIREVVFNLFKDESERRSSLGGLFYIIDGIKRLEQVFFIMPIKKKGRVRYKKAKLLNQQKSISKAVQLLMKHVQQKVFDTQQSYVNVLTREFKELYMGISQLYKKNDEVYQEIITLRYRRRYALLSGIYLAKYRKKREVYVYDRKKNIQEKKYQEVKKLKKARKVKKKFQKVKNLGVYSNLLKAEIYLRKHFKAFIKKKHKRFNKMLKKNSSKLLLPGYLSGLVGKYGTISRLVFKNVKSRKIIVFYIYHLINNIFKPSLKYLVKNLVFLIKKMSSSKDFLIKVSINMLEMWFMSLKVNSIGNFREKTCLNAWCWGNKVRYILTNVVLGDFFTKNWYIVYIKKVLYSTFDYYFILMHRYHKHILYRLNFLKKVWGVYRGDKLIKKFFYKKKRHNLYKHKKRGLKFPNVRLYSKKYLKHLLFMENVRKNYFTKNIKGIIDSIPVSLKEMRLKKAKILATIEN